MMTSLCPDTPDAKPTTVDAVNAQDVLSTTAGTRLTMMLSLGLIVLGTEGLLHHGRHHRSNMHRSNMHGQWANATEADEIPTVIAQCSVNIPELFEAAGVTGIDATMIHLEHGCCGDEICALGEDADSCAADCPAGTTGQLVWREDEHDHHHHRPHSRDEHDYDHGHGNHEEDAGAAEQPASPIHEEEDEESELEATSRDHRGRRGRGDRHLRIGKQIASAVMGVLGLVLLWSIRQNWVAVLRDFYIVLCPCGRSRPLVGPQEPHVNAIAVVPPSNGKSQSETVSVV